MKCPSHSEDVSDDYNPTADFAASIDECYRAIRERVAAGGSGWGGWATGVHCDAGGQGITQQSRPRPDSFSPLAVEDSPASVPSPLHKPAGDLMKYQFMPMFWGDFFANTLHLTAHEVGAYVLLIGHAWEHDGNIAVCDLQRVARVSNFHWPKVRSRLMQFFDTTTVLNNWHHDRVSSQLTMAAELSNKRKEAGRANAQQMLSKKGAHDPPSTLQLHIESLANGKGREAPQEKPPVVNYRDLGNDYRSPPQKKSDPPLQPLPAKLKAD
jgi:uncharacterized protein YdaU (DUF1376 family)